MRKKSEATATIRLNREVLTTALRQGAELFPRSGADAYRGHALVLRRLANFLDLSAADEIEITIR